MSSWDWHGAETISSSSEVQGQYVDWWNGGGAGLHTIPELLLIVQGVRHVELHCSVGECHDQRL